MNDCLVHLRSFESVLTFALCFGIWLIRVGSIMVLLLSGWLYLFDFVGGSN